MNWVAGDERERKNRLYSRPRCPHVGARAIGCFSLPRLHGRDVKKITMASVALPALKGPPPVFAKPLSKSREIAFHPAQSTQNCRFRCQQGKARSESVPRHWRGLQQGAIGPVPAGFHSSVILHAVMVGSWLDRVWKKRNAWRCWR